MAPRNKHSPRTNITFSRASPRPSTHHDRRSGRVRARSRTFTFRLAGCEVATTGAAAQQASPWDVCQTVRAEGGGDDIRHIAASLSGPLEKVSTLGRGA